MANPSIIGDNEDATCGRLTLQIPDVSYPDPFLLLEEGGLFSSILGTHSRPFASRQRGRLPITHSRGI